MATATETRRVEAPPAPGLSGRLYRLSVEQYDAMAQAGILTENAPVFLLEGLLVTKMTKNRPHVIASDLVQYALIRALPGGWYVSMQNPVVTAVDGKPEPDVAVVRGWPTDYVGRNVVAADVAMVVEVADSSLDFDATTMVVVYARAAIPTYWIVNLVAGSVEVYTEPTGPAEAPSYRQKRIFRPGEEVPLVVEGREVGRIAVADLLPVARGTP